MKPLTLMIKSMASLETSLILEVLELAERLKETHALQIQLSIRLAYPTQETERTPVVEATITEQYSIVETIVKYHNLPLSDDFVQKVMAKDFCALDLKKRERSLATALNKWVHNHHDS